MGPLGGADAVKRLRAQSGLSQSELASRAGMAQSAISNYERGRKEPSLSTLRRLAAASGLHADVEYTPIRRRESLASLRRRRRAILEICARFGASNPRIFGSTVNGGARRDSDIDLLVDLEEGRTLFDVAALHDELVELLGREVDIITPGALRGRLAHVRDAAVPL